MGAQRSTQGSLETPQLPVNRQPLMASEHCINTEDDARRGGREWDAFSWLLGLQVLFLLCNLSAAAMYSARTDPWKVAFAAGEATTLLCLFGALSAYDGAAPPVEASSTRRRRKLRVAIWALCTTLIFAYSYRAAQITKMPTALSLALWSSGAFVALVGLWPLICEAPDDPNACGAAPVESPPGSETPPQALMMASNCTNEEAARRQGRGRDTLSWLNASAMLFLCCVSWVALSSELGEISLVTGLSMNLLLIFGAFSAHDRPPPQDGPSPRRAVPRFAIWTLAMALNFYITRHAEPTSPAAVSLSMWLSGTLLGVVGLCVLIFQR